MISIQELHRQAMDMAEQALIHKHQGELNKADELFRQAYDQEKESAEFFKTLLNEEPTRSVFYRSAASLALQCQQFREAERLIATALSGNPPVEIAEELRELLENQLYVKWDRKLRQVG
jgi:tetratricopeptide (TPR) repeat protein